ncbi:MAG TPA: [FeFe] hydrogenase, group A, partial [Verrucomicrobiae bacterium]
GPATVVQAIGAGRRAAEAIDSFLTVGYVKEKNTNYNCSRGTLEDLPKWEFEEMPRIPRAPMPSLPVAQRIKNFTEVETGISEDFAKTEAGRCLKCGCTERFDCSLRKEARRCGISYAKPIHKRPRFLIDDHHPFIIRDDNKCIACGRCISACAEIEGVDVLAYRLTNGRQVVGTRSGRPLWETDCVSCGQCVNACPCGALDYRREKGKVFRAINDPNKVVVGFVAPAVRSVISSQLGITPPEASAYLAGLLKALGFDKVFDFSFAADLTVVEETTEFLTRVEKKGVMPQFTSCCPGWVNFVERRYPQLIPHLSSCKSPQQMMGATVKNHFAQWAKIAREKLFVVSIVPCLAKKQEAARPEFAPGGIRDVDAVLTTMEMLEMLKLIRFDTKDVKPAEFDAPYKTVSSAGVLFGASGGVAEAALRMAVEKITGKPLAAQPQNGQQGLVFEAVRGFEGVKEAVVKTDKATLKVAVVSSLKNAEPIIQKIIKGEDTGYDLIEVMACPGGCICGAGHPVPEKMNTLEKRQNVLVDIDNSAALRKSHENPDIMRLYEEFYKKPNSHLAHELLHTHYKPFERKTAANNAN